LSYTFVFRKLCYIIICGLKTIGHGNTDNNLESLCIWSIILKGFNKI
jgi:hypothetical protein